MTDRGSTYVLTKTDRFLGANVEELNINRSSIHQHRWKHQEGVVSQLKEFKAGIPLIIHWDGKLMQDLTSKDHVDWLPMLVSGKDSTQLLKVARLPNGKGAEMAKAVVQGLK